MVSLRCTHPGAWMAPHSETWILRDALGVSAVHWQLFFPCIVQLSVGVNHNSACYLVETLQMWTLGTSMKRWLCPSTLAGLLQHQVTMPRHATKPSHDGILR